MLAGHYAAAYAGKLAEPRVPLWALFLAAQFVDIIHMALLLVGVERTTLDPTLPTNPLVIEHVPYTHSLLATALWAGLVFVLAARRWQSRRSGLVLALVTLSHWLADLVMHRPDLTLFGRAPRLGLGLWNYPTASHVLELALLFGTMGLYLTKLRPARPLYIAITTLVLASVQAFAIFGPAPTSIVTLAISALAFFAIAAGLARWADPPVV